MPARKVSARAGQWAIHVRTWLEAACSCLHRAGEAEPARARAEGSLAEVELRWTVRSTHWSPFCCLQYPSLPGVERQDGEAETNRSLRALMTSAWNH